MKNMTTEVEKLLVRGKVEKLLIPDRMRARIKGSEVMKDCIHSRSLTG